jgi:ribonuclease HI
MPFYAVHKGKQRGIYTDWNECKKHIFGVRHPVFKKFNTKEEAEHFLIHGFGTKTNQSMADTLGVVVGGVEAVGGDAENNIDNDTHIIHAFTDGSLIRKKSKNGETKLLCGYGIYIPAYGLMDELRYAGTIRDNKTNNRGELKAIIEALNYILDFIDKVTGGVDGDGGDGSGGNGGSDGGSDGGDSTENEKLKKTKIVIYTDSSYSKLILGDTGVKYRKAGYLVSKKSGEEVKNADMVHEIMEIRDKISAYGMELIVKHVYAHTNLDTFEANGNRLADEYANIGANKTHLHAND